MQHSYSPVAVTRSIVTKRRLVLVGMPFVPIGIGEHLRCGVRALSAVGTTAGIIPLQGTECDDLDVKNEIGGYVVHQLSPEINIFYINGDMIEQSLREVQRLLPKSSYNIVYPMWELSKYPKYWAEQLNRFDEIWAPSKFTYESIKPAVTKPVVHIPLPGELSLSTFLGRRYFEIPESSFAFLFFFDFTSYLERKNPFAVLRAFEELCKRAPDEDLCLVIKIKGGETKDEDYRRFSDYISRFKNRLLVIDKVLTDNEVKNLLRCCDCFVSLHRSEGFGLGLITAMFLGKPVVATAYSGNMDFMTEANSCLVSYTMRDVPDGAYPFAEGQMWAEPDIAHAVDHMLKLMSDRDYARRVGENASRDVRVNFGYRATGLRYLSRAAEILL